MTTTTTKPSTPPPVDQPSKKGQQSQTKKWLIITFMCVMVYGFTKSIYNFRIAADAENIPTRDLTDLWYILAASLINLVKSPPHNIEKILTCDLELQTDIQLLFPRDDYSKNQSAELAR